MASERYERIGSVIERWHAEDAPVVIEAAVLMKDHQTDTVFAQLKCRHIGDGVITALTVSVQPFDSEGEPLGEAVEFTYDNIALAWQEVCGQKVPVVLPDNTTADMDVRVVKAVYESGYEWVADAEKAWSSIPDIEEPDDAIDPEEQQPKLPRWVIPTAIAVAVAVLLAVCWKPVFYGVGRLLYSVEEYTASAAVLQIVGDFADADERIADAKVAKACDLLRLYDYEGAYTCLGEEYANELMRDTITASLFLVGEWYDENGSYYFAMDDEGGVRYNLPASSNAAGVYSIDEGLFSRCDENGTAIPLWVFRVASGDEVVVEHRSGQVYTLYRYG